MENPEKEFGEALARIVLNKSGADDQFKVKVELSFGGKKYFAEEKDYLLESALIQAIGEVERMRRKDDIAYYEDWNEQREMKRSLGEALVEDKVVDEEDIPEEE